MSHFSQVAAALITSETDVDRVEEVVDALKHMHPTMQQTFWRTMQDVVAKVATDKYWDTTDLRNEASLEYVRAVSKLSGDHPLPRY